MDAKDASLDDVFRSIVTPALITVRCLSCGRERMTIVLDERAVERASRCDRCPERTELVETGPAPGACPCCVT